MNLGIPKREKPAPGTSTNTDHLEHEISKFAGCRGPCVRSTRGDWKAWTPEMYADYASTFTEGSRHDTHATAQPPKPQEESTMPVKKQSRLAATETPTAVPHRYMRPKHVILNLVKTHDGSIPRAKLRAEMAEMGFSSSSIRCALARLASNGVIVHRTPDGSSDCPVKTPDALIHLVERDDTPTDAPAPASPPAAPVTSHVEPPVADDTDIPPVAEIAVVLSEARAVLHDLQTLRAETRRLRDDLAAEQEEHERRRRAVDALLAEMGR